MRDTPQKDSLWWFALAVTEIMGQLEQEAHRAYRHDAPAFYAAPVIYHSSS